MKRWLVVGLLLTGCVTRTRIVETTDPDSAIFWRTESRRVMKWLDMDVARVPYDVYFSSQAECEYFRSMNPGLTKPDETCQPVHARTVQERVLGR